jgi:hypothetical protein
MRSRRSAYRANVSVRPGLPPAPPTTRPVIELVVGDTVLRVRGALGSAYVAELVTLLRSRCERSPRAFISTWLPSLSTYGAATMGYSRSCATSGGWIRSPARRPPWQRCRGSRKSEKTGGIAKGGGGDHATFTPLGRRAALILRWRIPRVAYLAPSCSVE